MSKDTVKGEIHTLGGPFKLLSPILVLTQMWGATILGGPLWLHPKRVFFREGEKKYITRGEESQKRGGLQAVIINVGDENTID